MGPISFEFINVEADRTRALALMAMLRSAGIRADLQQIEPHHHRIVVRFDQSARARRIVSDASESLDG